MAPYEEHEVTYADEKKIFYLAAGPKDGPLLIFIHGWPAIAKLWKPQLDAFAALGFRVVAPDMPGYGNSTARKVTEDYAQENVNIGMLALLKDVGREKAVWIGHDWGVGSVNTFAAVYPEHCIAAAALCVPYGVLELGVEEALPTVDRNIYPEDKFPYGQWSYQKFYETDFEKASAFFDADIPAFLRASRTKGNPDAVGKPSPLASVMGDGGWMGGAEKPDPNFRHIPLEYTVYDSEESYNEFVQAMEKTSFWPADAWYMNHAANRAYTLEKRKNGGNIEFPFLFIHATYDTVCATDNPKFTANMHKQCKNLTEARVDASHWVAEEKPQEVNAIIAKWLLEEVKGNLAGKVPELRSCERCRGLYACMMIAGATSSYLSCQ
ncbi:hypothetical protein Q7P37_008440 [Cladosporium fusiforme]